MGTNNHSSTTIVIDLFGGCGGMSWGLHKAGFRVVAAVDTWKTALETFQLNHPQAQVFCEDIRKLPAKIVMKQLDLKVGDLDCLIGGPPCQGFSKNVPAVGRFLNDPQNMLFRDFMDYVREFKPKVVVMENVAEIYNAYKGAVRAEIEKKLASLGYTTKTKVLYAPDYGIPQRRRRCFFFASRTDVPPAFPDGMFSENGSGDLFADVREYRSAWSAISDLPPLKNGDGAEAMEYDKEPQNDYQRLMRRDSSKLRDHITRKLNEKQMGRIVALKPGQAWKSLPKRLQPKSGYSGAYGRLDEKMLAPTITRWVFHPGSGRFCHPREPRLITIREAARIQSFSDDFKLTGTYIEKAHQIGNAVPPLFMMALASRIKTCLEGERGSTQRLLEREAVRV